MNRKIILTTLLVSIVLMLSVALAVIQYRNVNAQPSSSNPMKRPAPKEGTILAGVSAYCTDGDPAGLGYAVIRRYFNTVNNQQITISEGTQLGYCTIDFGFDVSSRFIIATVTHPDTPLGVTISSISGSEVTFFVWHAGPAAAVAGGDIFVIVY